MVVSARRRQGLFMERFSNVTSPQFRTALTRKLGNMFPGCTSVFQVTERGGLEFQLFDRAGQPRSDRVTINRAAPDTLTESSLATAIKSAGNPPGGFPRGFS